MLDKVYEQSTNLIVKAAFYYYIEGMSQSEISELLAMFLLNRRGQKKLEE